MYFRGVKVSIVVHFAVVVTIGMLLVGFVVLKLWQNQLLDYSLSQARLHLDVVAATWFDDCPAPDTAPGWLATGEEAGLRNVGGDFVLYHAGKLFGKASLLRPELEAALRNSATTRQESLTPLDRVWSLFGLIAGDIVVARPVIDACGVPGAVGYVVHMANINAAIFDKLSLILVYILVNAIILVTLGFFRMTGLVVKPLEKLVNIAETSRVTGTDVFAAGSRKNEFGQIASTLQNLFATIEADREKLKNTILSLEQANRQILDNQKSLITAEKFAVVGRLSAGLAHEIGNPLSIIQGYIDLLSRDDITTEEKLEYAQRSTRELARVNSLIRRLLDISRKEVAKVHRTSVRPVIEEIVSMLRMQKTRVPLTFSVTSTAEDLCVYVGEDDLHQVLLNCLLNSMDAVNETDRQQGEISVSCRFREDNGSGLVEIIIADNGPGIDEKHLSAVFDPFFTTKEPGHGTGLGLAVSHAIIENAGGSIAIDNGADSGAMVTIRLPVVA